MKQKSKKANSGITLIALVVTIVVLIILAAVSMNVLIGNNGILNKAKEAGEKNKLATIMEEVNLAWGAVQTEAYTTPEDGEFDEIASLQKELRKNDPEALVTYEGGDALNIFYKNTDLQLDYEGKITQVIKWEKMKWQDLQGSEFLLIGLADGKVYRIEWPKSENEKIVCFSDDKQSALYQKEIIQITMNNQGDGAITLMALDGDGKVYTIGANDSGELGNGTRSEGSDVAICISEQEGNVLKGKKIVNITSNKGENLPKPRSRMMSYGAMYAIDEEGRVYAWGTNADGQLGIGKTQEFITSPVCLNQIEGSALQGKKIKQLRNDGNHMVIALDEQGKVYTWGYSSYGQLGSGSIESESELPTCISDIASNTLYGKKITQIGQSAVIDSEGKVYTWGDNYDEQLGDGSGQDHSKTPICISDIEGSILKGKKIVKITGGNKKCVIDEAGNAYTWGGGIQNPKQLNENELQGKKIVQAVVINDYSERVYLLDENGVIYNENGYSETDNRNRSIYQKKIVQLKGSFGEYSSIAILLDDKGITYLEIFPDI